MFTVILVSIISLIGIGLSNTTYKQLMLSSGARNSQTAFYMSDMATECALYIDNVQPEILINGTLQVSCGFDRDGSPFLLNITSSGTIDDMTYYLVPASISLIDPCFRISINKKDMGSIIETTINGSGYNICDKSNNRTVERTIEVRY